MTMVPKKEENVEEVYEFLANMMLSLPEDVHSDMVSTYVDMLNTMYCCGPTTIAPVFENGWDVMIHDPFTFSLFRGVDASAAVEWAKAHGMRFSLNPEGVPPSRIIPCRQTVSLCGWVAWEGRSVYGAREVGDR